MFLEKKVYLNLNEEQIIKINLIFKKLILVYDEGINLIKVYYKKYKNFISRDYLVRNYRSYTKLNFLKTLEPLLINYTLYMALDACIEACKKRVKVSYKYLTYKKHQIKIASSLIKDIKKDSITIKIFKGETKSNIFKLKKLAQIPKDRKLYDVKLLFDGINFFLIFALDTEERSLAVPKSSGIGIDVGIKNLATISDGRIYPNIAFSKRMKYLFEKRKKLTVKLGRYINYDASRDKDTPSCNVLEIKTQLRKVDNKIKNLRKDYLHKVSSEIIKKNPAFIVIETLDIKEMSMRNKSIGTNFLKASVGMFLDMIIYKAKLYSIPLYKVKENYPSSKMCCNCGNIKSKLSISERQYCCEKCKIEIDRDINASINLFKYGLMKNRNERLRLNTQICDYYGNMYLSRRSKVSKYIKFNELNKTKI